MHYKLEQTMRDASFQPYYDASQFRLDTWNELKVLTIKRERYESERKDTTQVQEEIASTLDTLDELESYFVFPGPRGCRQLRSLFDRGLYIAQARQTERLVRLLVGGLYRSRDMSETFLDNFDKKDAHSREITDGLGARLSRPYFEVLVVDELGAEQAQETRRRMLKMRRDQDDYVYDVITVTSLEDAVIATLFNHNIQTVIVRYNVPMTSRSSHPLLRSYLNFIDRDLLNPESASAASLAEALKSIRPEIDLFLVTDDPIKNVAGHTGKSFRRVFYHQEDYLELHLSILLGIHDRYETPFFNALREYSHRPTGVFHAMPISRGKSIRKSHWIKDMGKFYGENIFLAETSATTGGLDSLLQPHGPIKSAQEKVARAFGARKSYFVTNGTSTANKVVVQALLSPGDIALVSRDCHKSHHYALVLSGSKPVYMDPFPLQRFSMYGAVSLRSIKSNLLDLKKAGKLDQVKMLLLTNCTFDGVIYHPERIMREVLAIKPDICFVWDEAWFAFARFSPTYRQRTAMHCAGKLRTQFQSDEYRAKYQAWKAEFDRLDPNESETWLDRELLPDPDRARVRVYSTQSTHKTLTSLRQGSMIHVHDQDFGRLVNEAFEEAYMTHTSTSPNYQILASLDVGRRQVELEGYEMVEQSVALAMTLRERIQESPLLSRYFQVLKPRELIPEIHRPSNLEEFYSPQVGYSAMGEAWKTDEFVLDPTRVTLHIGQTGMEGDTFRKLLMNRFDIQINKTSRNTLLFMLNIGTTRGAIAYLLEVLTQVARELNEKAGAFTELEDQIARDRVESLTRRLPPLPDFSRFHPRFTHWVEGTPEGDIREAFFLGRDNNLCEFLRLDGAIQAEIERGRQVVSAAFVTPYPPGFPVLVPGQVVSRDILDYLLALDVKEIHGYNPDYGLRVFGEKTLTKKEV